MIRMINWMYGHMRLNRIKNKVNKDKIKVAPIEDKMKKPRFK